MLKVGIHENLVLEKALKNEKGTLGLVFVPKRLDDAAPRPKRSFFEEAETTDVTERESSPLLLFPFKIPTYKGKDGEDLTDAEKGEAIQRDMKNFRLQLTFILGAYRAIKDFKFDPWRNTGLTPENWETNILDNDVLQTIYNNYVEDFLAGIAPFMGDHSRPVRLKLVRQSKDKHYATLPSRYIEDNPFIEPMEVPAEASKLKFTKWEIDNKFDNGDPVSRAQADPVDEQDAPPSSGSVFGSR